MCCCYSFIFRRQTVAFMIKWGNFIFRSSCSISVYIYVYIYIIFSLLILCAPCRFCSELKNKTTNFLYLELASIIQFESQVVLLYYYNTALFSMQLSVCMYLYIIVYMYIRLSDLQVEGASYYYSLLVCKAECEATGFAKFFQIFFLPVHIIIMLF